MSQIEIVMYFALGVVLLTLVIMFLGRVIWRTALNAGKRTIKLGMPARMAEIDADRSRLKAEYAMLSGKLEYRIGELKARLANQMAEATRNRNRVNTLVDELKSRNADLIKANGELNTMRAAHDDMAIELSSRTETMQKLKAEINALKEDYAVEHGENQAEMKTAVNDVAYFSDKSASSKIQHRIDKLNSLGAEIDQQREDKAKTEETVPEPKKSRRGKKSKLTKTKDSKKPNRTILPKANNDDKPQTEQNSDTDRSFEVATKTGMANNVISIANRIRALQKASKS